MPGYAGRLIRPQRATFKLLDVEATAANDIDGGTPGGHDGGYDHILGEVVAWGPDDNRQTARVETEVKFLVQVEPEKVDEANMLGGGTEPARRMSLIAFVPALRAAGLQNPDGSFKIKFGDRLYQLRHRLYNTLLAQYDDPQGMYVTQVQPISWGFPSADNNLLQIVVTQRRQGQ